MTKFIVSPRVFFIRKVELLFAILCKNIVIYYDQYIDELENLEITLFIIKIKVYNSNILYFI